MLYGYLFQWSGFDDVENGANGGGSAFHKSLARVSQFSNVTGKQGVRTASVLPEKWSAINFRSHEPLAGEEPEGNMLRDFEYRVFLRVNPEAGSVIFASKRYKISDAAIATFNAFVAPKLQRRHIRVAELTHRLFQQRNSVDYYVTFFLADVPGYGEALKSLSLSGDDVGGAGFFKMRGEGTTKGSGALGLQFEDFTARQVGLRSTDSRFEFGRFGSAGNIQFPDDTIGELDEFLSYASV